MKTPTVCAAIGLTVLWGCASSAPGTPRAPVDLSQFAIGESRGAVLEQLEMPAEQINDADRYCDVYEFHTLGSAVVTRRMVLMCYDRNDNLAVIKASGPLQD